MLAAALRPRSWLASAPIAGARAWHAAHRAAPAATFHLLDAALRAPRHHQGLAMARRPRRSPARGGGMSSAPIAAYRAAGVRCSPIWR